MQQTAIIKNEMKQQEIINKAVYEIESKQIFEQRVLDGRISRKTRDEFKTFIENHNREANLLMQLAYHWSK